MTTIVKSYKYFLDSSKRTSGTISNLQFNVPPITLQSSENMFRVKVLNMVCPFRIEPLHIPLFKVERIMEVLEFQKVIIMLIVYY